MQCEIKVNISIDRTIVANSFPVGIYFCSFAILLIFHYGIQALAHSLFAHEQHQKRHRDRNSRSPFIIIMIPLRSDIHKRNCSFIDLEIDSIRYKPIDRS